MSSSAAKKKRKEREDHMKEWGKYAARKPAKPGRRAKKKHRKAVQEINALAQETRPKPKVGIESVIKQMLSLHGAKG